MDPVTFAGQSNRRGLSLTQGACPLLQSGWCRREDQLMLLRDVLKRLGPSSSGKRSRTRLCTNSNRKAGVRVSGTLQGISIDMGVEVLYVRTCSNSQVSFWLVSLY